MRNELPIKVDRYVGHQIRKERISQGLTQQQLSKKMKISYQQVQKYETGANRISAGRLYEIAMIFQVDVLHFYEGFNSGVKQKPMQHGGRDKISISVVNHFLGIKNIKLRYAVANLLRVLVSSEK